MKRLNILVAGSVLVSLLLLSTVAAMYRVGQPKPVTPPTTPYQDELVDRGPTTAPVAPSIAPRQDLDPNKVKAAISAHKGLDAELDQVDKKGLSETSEWLSDKADNQLSLMKSVDEQVRLELALIRKLAAEEGARKTTAAIDGVLLNRQARMDKVIERMRALRRDQLPGRTLRGRTPRTRSDLRGRTQDGTGVGGAAVDQTVPEGSQDQRTRYPVRRR